MSEELMLNKVCASERWVEMLEDVMRDGHVCSPRGMKIKELIAYKSVVDMTRPVVTVKNRKLSRKFLGAEAVWIMQGDNRVETITPYNKNIGKFSDDGIYFNGAYGPRVVDQLTYVTDQLLSDPDTRQAVMTIWRPNPRPSKDIPCTVAIQWFIRNHVDGMGVSHNLLHCVDTMRSSDAWLGWPYDIFNFSMLSAYVALMVKAKGGPQLELGTLSLVAGSQHVYETNWGEVRKCIEDATDQPYNRINLRDFNEPQDLIRHLQAVRDADRGSMVRSDFLAELLP